MQGARAVQQSILRDFPNVDISVSIVWIQMPGFHDNETTAKRMAGSFNDPRVKHFFDPFPAHRAGKAFAKNMVTRGPAWDIYFFYKKGDEWGALPPSPSEWMHQLGSGGRADAKHFRTGSDLIDQLHETMHTITGAKCAE